MSHVVASCLSTLLFSAIISFFYFAFDQYIVDVPVQRKSNILCCNTAVNSVRNTSRRADSFLSAKSATVSTKTPYALFIHTSYNTDIYLGNMNVKLLRIPFGYHGKAV